MPTNKLSKEEKLDKELKTFVSKMKSENTALNKILTQLKSKEELLAEKKADKKDNK